MPLPQKTATASDAGYKVGHVISVSGSTVTGILHIQSQLSDADAGGPDLSAPIQIGAVLKIGTPKSVVFGIVSSLRIVDPAHDASMSEHKLVDIELMGEAVMARNGQSGFTFQRGVSIYPALGETIFTTTQEELAWVYARPSTSNVRIGTLYQNDHIPAYLVTDDLLGKHFAVLGTTGAGKSCSVALMLRAILQKHPNGHIVLLDPHNEYSQAFGELAQVLNTDNLELPYWLFNFEEICGVLVENGRPDSDIQVEILGRAILEAKYNYAGTSIATTHITVDSPVPYNVGELIKILDVASGQLEKPEGAVPYLRLKSRIEALRGDTRFGFMFPGLVVKDNLQEIVSTMFRIPVAGKPMTILDLSAVPADVVDVVVSVLCRTIFDFCVWSGSSQSMPVLLVCEEAHRYVPQDEQMSFGPTKRMISRIAKEGRKYGVSLCLVTQRPSELSTSILSQCNTLFALRMSNDRDQEFVRRALPESGLGLMSALPSLHTQEAVAVGEGVTVPMRMRFDDLAEAHRPRSATACFSTAWQNDSMTPEAVAQTIQRWRMQLR